MSRWQTLAAVDFDKWACATYAANFPGVDVRCCTVAEALPTLPQCDVLLGGPPCQSFSTAGERKGEADERNGWPDMIAAVAKLQPRMFLAENVPGMLTAKMLPYTRKVYRQLTECGYRVEKRMLNAVHCGVPQMRNRMWLWGIRNAVYAAGVRHNWPEPTHYCDVTTKAVIPPPMMRGLLLPGVTVGQALGLDGTLVQDARPIAKAQNGAGVRPINAPAYTVDGMATQGITSYRWSAAMLRKHPPAQPAQPAQTVVSNWFKGGAEGLLSVDGRTWDSRHPVPTVNEPSTTVRARSPRDSGRCTECVIAVPAGAEMLVRRLTPDECARLQSCPDDMLWPAKITKTAKYKIIGNGWACGMAAALSRALAAADPESVTVVDLFAGGGLGALGWHQRYWRMT